MDVSSPGLWKINFDAAILTSSITLSAVTKAKFCSYGIYTGDSLWVEAKTALFAME